MTLPKLSRSEAVELALEAWEKDGNKNPLPQVYFLMWRGYRLRTMGNPTRNDVGINDDAGWLISGDDVFLPENLNTDPSRLGWNASVGKPYGMLKPGVWWFYYGPHKGRLPAFRQADNAAVAKKLGIPHNGKFHVTRMWGWDDKRNYSEWGHQQINIHSQVMNSTSSWLCITVPFNRSDAWLNRANKELRKYNQKTIPVILIER
jgi:hypothetical protein